MPNTTLLQVHNTEDLSPLSLMPNSITKRMHAGRYVFRKGRLVATSQDIYLVTEYADQGDLFNLRGQLREDEVRSIMAQLLSATR